MIMQNDDDFMDEANTEGSKRNRDGHEFKNDTFIVLKFSTFDVQEYPYAQIAERGK
jgi:hypothetical protein